MNNPKISILLPTFNRNQLLVQALDSLLHQNYDNFEVIVVDDCSTDDTFSAVKIYQENMKIVYHRNTRRLGAASNFSYAAQLSSGDYLLSFSDDDKLEKDALSELGKNCVGYDLVYFDMIPINDCGQRTGSWTYKDYTNPIDLLNTLITSGMNVIPEGALLSRKVYFDSYGEMYSKRFITPFYLPHIFDLKMKYLNKELYRYRIHAGSTFKDTNGLVVRNNGVVNFMNLIMMMYPPEKIFGFDTNDYSENISQSIQTFCMKLMNHGNGFIQGRFYTGVEYSESDMLWGVFYEMAAHWIAIANKYGEIGEITKSEFDVKRFLNAVKYDKVRHGNLPEIYHKLPWFAYRPPAAFGDFVSIDMVTYGDIENNHDLFGVYQDERIGLYEEGGGTCSVVENKMITDIDELEEHVKYNPFSIINVAEDQQGVADMLVQYGKYFVNFVNLVPEVQINQPMLKNIINYEWASDDIYDYLRMF